MILKCVTKKKLNRQWITFLVNTCNENVKNIFAYITILSNDKCVTTTRKQSYLTPYTSIKATQINFLVWNDSNTQWTIMQNKLYRINNFFKQTLLLHSYLFIPVYRPSFDKPQYIWCLSASSTGRDKALNVK